MKRLTEWVVVGVMLLSMTIFNGCNTYRQGIYGSQTSYENPSWGPSYYGGTRYYYLPDIESYYDLHTREFIFLNHAQWIYSPYLPSVYSYFDLNTSFIVLVNSNIYQPWMHHQYYVSHFPRYYYRDYYDHSNIPYVRGFNENSSSAIYWSEDERDRARSWDDKNLRTGRQFKYSKEDRQQQKNMNNSDVYRQSSDNRYSNDNTRVISPEGNDNASPPRPANTPEMRRPHNTNYYGIPIGQPVKVDRQMRIQNTTRNVGRSNINTETQRNSSGNENEQNRQGRR